MDATPVELNIGGVPVSGPMNQTFTSGLMVVGDAAGQADPINGAGIENSVVCAKIAGDVALEAIENEDTSSKSLKKYEDIWKSTIGKSIKNSLKYRKIIDKLSDEDFNAIAEFLEDKGLESISKLSILKFLKSYPHLITLMLDFFI